MLCGRWLEGRYGCPVAVEEGCFIVHPNRPMTVIDSFLSFERRQNLWRITVVCFVWFSLKVNEDVRCVYFVPPLYLQLQWERNQIVFLLFFFQVFRRLTLLALRGNEVPLRLRRRPYRVMPIRSRDCLKEPQQKGGCSHSYKYENQMTVMYGFRFFCPFFYCCFTQSFLCKEGY